MQYRALFVSLIIGLFIMQPVSSYVDWHNGSGHGHGGGFGHHDRSFIGVNFSVWPDNYYYYGAPYYYAPDDAVLVSPPIEQQAVEVVQPPVVIENQGVVPAIATPAAASDTEDSFTINIPNNKGSYTAITLKKSGNGFIGPQGEFYPEFPKVAQLKVIYGK